MKPINWAIAHTPNGISLYFWQGHWKRETYCATWQEAQEVLEIERGVERLQHCTEIPKN